MFLENMKNTLTSHDEHSSLAGRAYMNRHALLSGFEVKTIQESKFNFQKYKDENFEHIEA
jgi:hypothetical protein